MMLWQRVQQDKNIRQERELLTTAKLLKNNELGYKPRHCGRNICGEMNRKQTDQQDSRSGIEAKIYAERGI
jgi:hypothetical protein